MIDKKFAVRTILYSIAFLLILGYLACTTIGHASVPKKSDTTCWLPEGCVTQYTENPYTYKVGNVSAVGFVDKSITLRLQPLATYGLFSEDILFCDQKEVATLFAEKHNPVVLTYKTKASRLIQGVGCHDLVRVDEMAVPKEVQ
jgi:hypothetical protein